MTAARPFKEARDLDAREAECWAMFDAQPPQWGAELVRECRPVVMTVEQFYAHLDDAMTRLLRKTDRVDPDRAETNLAKIVCISTKITP